MSTAEKKPDEDVEDEASEEGADDETAEDESADDEESEEEEEDADEESDEEEAGDDASEEEEPDDEGSDSDEEEGGEDDEDGEDEEEAAEPAAAAKAAPIKPAGDVDPPNKPKVGGAKPAKVAAKKAEPVKGRPAARARRVVKRSPPTRNVIIFILIVGGLAAAFGALGSSGGGAGPVGQPAWKIGEVKDIDITLVTTDHRDLACAMKEEVKGRRCAFEAQNKRAANVGDSRSDSNLLQPYTTVDGNVQLFAAGLWTQPALKAKLDKENWDRPSPRFTVKCKLTVEGRSKTAFAQWKPGEGWNPANGWFVGSVSDCSIK
jgi:hypothetical protein